MHKDELHPSRSIERGGRCPRIRSPILTDGSLNGQQNRRCLQPRSKLMSQAGPKLYEDFIVWELVLRSGQGRHYDRTPSCASADDSRIWHCSRRQSAPSTQRQGRRNRSGAALQGNVKVSTPCSNRGARGLSNWFTSSHRKDEPPVSVRKRFMKPLGRRTSCSGSFHACGRSRRARPAWSAKAVAAVAVRTFKMLQDR